MITLDLDEEDIDIVIVALRNFREILENDGNLYPYTVYEVDTICEKLEK